jgi:hypothetical protein
MGHSAEEAERLADDADALAAMSLAARLRSAPGDPAAALSAAEEDGVLLLATQRDDELLAVFRNFGDRPVAFRYHAARLLSRRGLAGVVRKVPQRTGGTLLDTAGYGKGAFYNPVGGLFVCFFCFVVVVFLGYLFFF